MINNQHILIIPPPQIGGGASNAVLRCMEQFGRLGHKTTTNIFAPWHSALLNVGIGIRYDALRFLQFGRRIVYRVDGCYVEGIFEKEGNRWLPEYERINDRIKKALQASDFVIYQSIFSKNWLDRLFRRPTGTYDIIHNGVDIDIFSPNNRVRNQTPVIGCIGKFRHNRISIIIDISKRLKIKHRLLLVGRIDERSMSHLIEYQQSVNHCSVEYIQPVTSDSELSKYHRLIDCFIHPALSDTCPNSIVEALASGTPPVVLESTGGSELVQMGGIVVKTPLWDDYEKFLDDFAASIIKILENWEHYSIKARQRAVDKLNIRDVAQKYLEALEPY